MNGCELAMKRELRGEMRCPTSISMIYFPIVSQERIPAMGGARKDSRTSRRQKTAKTSMQQGSATCGSGLAKLCELMDPPRERGFGSIDATVSIFVEKKG